VHMHLIISCYLDAVLTAYYSKALQYIGISSYRNIKIAMVY